MTRFRIGTRQFLFRKAEPKNCLSMVFTTVALDAPDQLRQRMAFALAQIFVVGADHSDHCEQFLAYYDIFVRHAFGSLRDVLMEVSYSPVMGEYLTYRGSKSIAESNAFPDENYARELMQLFTVGLWQLRSDGLPELDASGERVPTYDIDDIVRPRDSSSQSPDPRARARPPADQEIDSSHLPAGDVQPRVDGVRSPEGAGEHRRVRQQSRGPNVD